jgi:hypothetical protein
VVLVTGLSNFFICTLDGERTYGILATCLLRIRGVREGWVVIGMICGCFAVREYVEGF